MDCKTDIYYQKFFDENTKLQELGLEPGDDVGQHTLNIYLNKKVTKEMLLSEGFVLGTWENCEGDFFVDEDGTIHMQALSIPLNGDCGYGYGEDEEGALPYEWEEEVPKLIGLPDDWVDGTALNG
jgi:hypothetical protein